MYNFLYNTTSGLILAASTNSITPGTGEAVLSAPSNDDTAILAYNNPNRYLITGSTPTLVAQPYWTVVATESTTTSGEYTLTATLNNPPSTPPTSATFAVAGGTIIADMTSDQATATVQVHPTVAMLAISVTVSATGTVSGSTTIGGTTTPPIGLQLLPATSSAPALVAPTGPGSKAYGRAFYLGVSSQTQIEVLTEALQDLYSADSLALNTIFASNGILAALTSGASPLMTLTADEQNAWTDFQTNVLGSMPVTLANAYPSGGTRLPLYQSMVTMAPVFAQGALGYMQYLTTIPNLD